VRRNATRWRMPPDSSCGRARSKPSRPNAANSGRARSRACRGLAPPTRGASAALSIALIHGSRRSRWGMRTAGADCTVPVSGACRPQTSSSSVVLPQPLGPTTATVSPAATVRDTSASAGTGAARRRAKPRLTPASRISASSPRTFRGSCAGASSLVCIAPSAGITPQVRRVSARVRGRYLSRPPPAPLWSRLARKGTAPAVQRAEPTAQRISFASTVLRMFDRNAPA
jgi:hypothetical protein